jgi:hypothetical protein
VVTAASPQVAPPTVDIKTRSEAASTAGSTNVFFSAASTATTSANATGTFAALPKAKKAGNTAKEEIDIAIILEEQHRQETQELKQYLQIPQKVEELKKRIKAEEILNLPGQLYYIHQLEARVSLNVAHIQLAGLINFEPILLLDYLNVRRIVAELRLLKDQFEMGRTMADILEIPTLSKDDEKLAETSLLDSIQLGCQQLKKLLSFKKIEEEANRIQSRLARVAKKSADYEFGTEQLERLRTAFGTENIKQVVMDEAAKNWEQFTRLKQKLKDQYSPSRCCCS